MAVLRVTDDTTKDDLAITIGLLNADAKQLSRRGKVGTLTPEYQRLHDIINEVIDDYQRAPA